MEQLNLTQEWDKVFPKSGKVEHSKVAFYNRCWRAAWSTRCRRTHRSS